MLVKRISEDLITYQAKQHWLAYWRYFSKDKHTYCAEVNCLNQHHQAVLVSSPSTSDNQTFVIPLCKQHSDNFKQQMEVSDKVELIPYDLTL